MPAPARIEVLSSPKSLFRQPDSECGVHAIPRRGAKFLVCALYTPVLPYTEPAGPNPIWAPPITLLSPSPLSMAAHRSLNHCPMFMLGVTSCPEVSVIGV